MIYFPLKLKLAEKQDFLDRNMPRYGKMYFVASVINKEIQGPHYLFNGQDFEELGAWIRQKRIYITETSLSQDKKPKI